MQEKNILPPWILESDLLCQHQLSFAVLHLVSHLCCLVVNVRMQNKFKEKLIEENNIEDGSSLLRNFQALRQHILASPQFQGSWTIDGDT